MFISNKEVVEILFSEVWNKGNIDLIDKIYHVEFKAHYTHPPNWETGKKGVIKVLTSIRNDFIEYREHIEDIICENDRVSVRITITGESKGVLNGRVTNKGSIKIEEIIIFRLKDRKIIEQWGVPDILSLYNQLNCHI